MRSLRPLVVQASRLQFSEGRRDARTTSYKVNPARLRNDASDESPSLRFRWRGPAAGRAAGFCATQPGGAGGLLRHKLMEVRRVAWADLHAEEVPRSGQVLAQEVRGRMPAGVRRDVPGGRRRLQLLPVPDG